jgi:aminopeptidase N
MEQASGRSLETFFSFWIYGQNVPSLEVKWKVDPNGTRAQIELAQSPDAVGEFPVTVTRVYRDGTTDEETVVVSSLSTTLDRPIRGRLRSVEINRDRFTPLAR